MLHKAGQPQSLVSHHPDFRLFPSNNPTRDLDRTELVPWLGNRLREMTEITRR